ncbi:MAG: MBL fold metallo-hydrolase [Anaerolineales bacterium]|jgi:phosphoribosyl 1,2-cyclic phosphodiesterase
MRVTLRGTRGSLASPGPDTLRYGGNTACVLVEGSDGTQLVLDAGTGIRGLGKLLPTDLERVHILLTHLHMDHIQGLPFFAPLRRPEVEVNIWGPASTTLSLNARLLRYLSPPLFPVSLREIAPNLFFYELPSGTVEIGEFRVTAQMVIHINPTVGYRVEGPKGTVTYLPDHEPVLSCPNFPDSREWTSGYALAKDADLLIHDAQYTTKEYNSRVGFGHSSINQAIQFAGMAGVRQFVTFHHDPTHDDDMLDQMIADTLTELKPDFEVTPGREGLVFDLGRGG